jgi:hypothetical protein
MCNIDPLSRYALSKFFLSISLYLNKGMSSDTTIKKEIVCAECKKEIPVGCMAISYRDKLFDSYRCLATSSGVVLEGSSLSTILDKSTLKTI